jgi:hypothetical protein
MPRIPPPVPGAANRRRLITQFNQRLKQRPVQRIKRRTGPARPFKARQADNAIYRRLGA